LIFFKGPVDKLLFPLLVRRIESHRLHGYAETECALRVFQVLVLYSDVDVVDLHLQVVNDLGHQAFHHACLLCDFFRGFLKILNVLAYNQIVEDRHRGLVDVRFLRLLRGVGV
jgi:hypothetical protein